MNELPFRIAHRILTKIIWTEKRLSLLQGFDICFIVVKSLILSNVHSEEELKLMKADMTRRFHEWIDPIQESDLVSRKSMRS